MSYMHGYPFAVGVFPDVPLEFLPPEEEVFPPCGMDVLVGADMF